MEDMAGEDMQPGTPPVRGRESPQKTGETEWRREGSMQVLPYSGTSSESEKSGGLLGEGKNEGLPRTHGEPRRMDAKKIQDTCRVKKNTSEYFRVKEMGKRISTS